MVKEFDLQKMMPFFAGAFCGLVCAVMSGLFQIATGA